MPDVHALHSTLSQDNYNATRRHTASLTLPYHAWYLQEITEDEVGGEEAAEHGGGEEYAAGPGPVADLIH